MRKTWMAALVVAFTAWDLAEAEHRDTTYTIEGLGETRVEVADSTTVTTTIRHLRPKPRAKRGYPRLFFYGWHRWNSPFVNGGAAYRNPGTIDTALVEAASGYDLLILDPFRVGVNQQVQEMIRERAPGAIRLAYFDAGRFFQCQAGWVGGPVPYGCDTTGQNPLWSRWVVVRAHNAVLYRQSGVIHDAVIDYAQPGLADEMADTVFAWTTGEFSGTFIDELNTNIMWSFPKTDSVDYARAGFASALDWSNAYNAGVERFYGRLRELLGDRPLAANGGQRGVYETNGWMRENNPYQPNDSVAEYLIAESLHTQPVINLRTAWMRHSNFRDPYAQKRARFTLAFASLGSGYGGPTWSPQDLARGWGFTDLWMDEYAVSPVGVAVRDPSFKGWLGHPLGPAYQVRGVDRVQLGAWRRDFENGCVLLYEGLTGAAVYDLKGYRRIGGFQDPQTNGGQSVERVTLGPQDALFLVREAPTSQWRAGTGDAPGPGLPATLTLSSAYPSPSVERTSFALDLPGPSRVSFSVHDLQGRRVWGQPERVYKAGRQVLAWDGGRETGGRASTGLYLARVVVEGRQLVRPIALIR